MIATLPFISRTFARFNALCFGGRLTPPAFSLSRSCRAAGQLRYKRSVAGGGCTLSVSTRFDLPEEALEDVVLHEMIHYHIVANRLRDTSAHGVLFRQIMARLNATYGRHVTVSLKRVADGGVVADAAAGESLRVFCVARTEDGKYGVTVCARTRVFALNRSLRRHYRLLSLRWYCTRDPFFSRFPRSLTPRLYHISGEDVQLHVTGGQAVPLTF